MIDILTLHNTKKKTLYETIPAVKIPGSLYRADNIVAPLYDRCRNVSDFVDVVKNITLGKKASVDKVV